MFGHISPCPELVAMQRNLRDTLEDLKAGQRSTNTALDSLGAEMRGMTHALQTELANYKQLASQDLLPLRDAVTKLEAKLNFLYALLLLLAAIGQAVGAFK